MAALIMYLCKNCGKIRWFTEAEDKQCSCGTPNFICLDVNPVEYNKMSQNQKDALIMQKLNIQKLELTRQQTEWKKIREAVDNEYYAERLKELNAQRQANAVKCPYCNSTNVSKISTAGRVVSVGLFGLGSSKVGKQWHCNNCKSDF